MLTSALNLGEKLKINEEELRRLTKDPVGHYKILRIKKKDGGKRTLFIPDSDLRAAQLRLLALLRVSFSLPECVYGFDAAHTIIDNARYHQRGKYQMNLDIRDFFPSVHSSRVRRILSKEFSGDALELVVRITTLHHSLPQGVATSPLIASLALSNLDSRLMALSAKEGLHYSRYFDDLSFSAMRPVAPYRALVETILRAEGYPINHKKTVLYNPGDTRIITGIEIAPNGSLHIPREQDLYEYLRKVAGEGLSSLEDDAVFKSKNALAGKVNFIASVNPEMGAKLQTEFKKIGWPD